MCDCEAHGNDLRDCSCLCDEHDRLFYSGLVVLRKQARNTQSRLYAMNQLYDDVHADISRLTARLDDIPEPVEATLEVAADPTLDLREDWTEVRVKPWEPDLDGTESDPLATSFLQAVGTASMCWKDEYIGRVFDSEKALWVASGLQRWIESRYQLFDQPAHNGGVDDIAVIRETRDDYKRLVEEMQTAIGELRTDFIRIHDIAGQHAAYEGNKA